ncbi:50S ribosomal protein P1 [Natronomonas halophila]|uniref:50S ribosomal protein P1 n=1 Tax=Natronomonas halophila TaxID=2747817 RepID=UPI001FE8094E|nr:50S ribosomal protein P1 [Natronomonas halophila]
MEYAYAALLLAESGEELNERNLRAVLEAANCAVAESRVKALVAALEGVDTDSVGPENVAQLGGEAAPDASAEDGTGEEADGRSASEMADAAPTGAATEPAGGDTRGERGDESG